MIEFKREYKKTFSETGYLKIRNKFDLQDIKFIKQDLETIYREAINKHSSIPVRCYKDLPYFLSKGVNIASIEDPFFY